MTRAYIGIGSNLGDRAASIELALRSLHGLRQTSLLRCSTIFESEPVGPGDQDLYLNAVAEVATRLAPGILLASLLEIESRAGRVRRERWGPRTLDLDLLLYGEQSVEEPGLQVPHPRLFERSFVLEPLSELIGGRVIDGSSIAARADALRDATTMWVWQKTDLNDQK